MLKQEFEDRTNLQVNEEEFNAINAIYMACTNEMDKDAFCADYKKHADSVIVTDLTKRVETLRRVVHYHDRREDEMENYLIDLAHDLDEPSIDRKAEEMWGLYAVITRKIDKGYALDSVQLEYVKNNLK